MKKLLLSAALLSAAFGFSQELLLNGGGDDLTVEAVDEEQPDGSDIRIIQGNTGDNADAFDMTDPSEIITNAAATAEAANAMSGVVGAFGASSTSPYGPTNNSALDAYLNTFYSDGSEVAGSTSDGNKFAGLGDRGFKINEPGRRLYQVVTVTPGENYIFSIDSRAEVAGTPTEVFMLNAEIADETAINAADPKTDDPNVDAYLNITNDVNANKSSSSADTFTTNTLQFQASGSTIVVYVRSTSSVSGSTEVFYDNLSLKVDTSLSSNDITLDGKEVKVFQDANGNLNVGGDVEVNATKLYNISGQEVAIGGNSLDVSTLSPGVYIATMESSNGDTAAKKVVITE